MTAITFRHLGGPARQTRTWSRRSILNALSLLFFAGSAIMLGKSSWIYLKAEVAQVLLDRAFTQSMITGKHVKGWNWADTWPVAKLEIPRINGSAIVLDGSTGEALAFGPGHLRETPRIGERGTAVIAAHRDFHFRFLKDVQVGDEIELTRTDGLKFKYRVTKLRVADWDKSGIDRLAPGFNLVLSTCYPFNVVTPGQQRYIVEAVMAQ
jgi:sortase A